MMAQMIRNSALSALIRICLHGHYWPHHPGDLEKAGSSSVRATGQADENEKSVHLVGWDGPDDVENPLNFSGVKKGVITALTCVYTWAIYVGSSIYTSSQPGIEHHFGVDNFQSSFGLAIYVLAYGLGGLLFSPLSEVPSIGRNPPYAISGALFVVLCVPTSLVDNYAGLMVLRFLLGFMGSPCLATAGATLGDIWGPARFPYFIGLWACTTALGPALGPMLSSFAVESLGWRFSSWELLIISGSVFVVFVALVPETAAPTILYYRAKRLRELTGDQSYMSEEEIKQAKLTAGQRLWGSIIKPWEVNVKDPALLFMTLYMGLIYAIVYSFFESLPLVYPPIYGFSPTSTSLIWLAVVPAGAIGFPLHCFWLSKRVEPKIRDQTFGDLENFLETGVAASLLMPASLFMFARPSIHWMVPTVAIFLYMVAQYFLTNSVFLYIPAIYPRYAASIFAANSVARALLAFVAVLVGRPMFKGIGIDGGVSLLGGLTAVCAALLAGLYWSWGKRLRARSRFAA
ncbi:Transporter mfs1 [Fonsecaea pedrosoi]|nr:Transporter mfs1 [Fonsecaea pedrosoi]